MGVRPVVSEPGSRLALGFTRRESIYEESLKYHEIEMFVIDEDVHSTMSGR